MHLITCKKLCFSESYTFSKTINIIKAEISFSKADNVPVTLNTPTFQSMYLHILYHCRGIKKTGSGGKRCTPKIHKKL